MNTNTYATKKEDIEVNWHHFDAKDKVVGRLSNDIVKFLLGKHKVNYAPYLNCGDKVVVTNVSKIKFTGNKEEDKMYFRHSKRVKGFKEENASMLRSRKPTEILKLSVKGMLPKNKLRKIRLSNLILIDGENNPHTAQTDKK